MEWVCSHGLRPRGALQKIPRVEGNGCVPMALAYIVTGPPPYRGIARDAEEELGQIWERVSNPEALEAAVLLQRSGCNDRLPTKILLPGGVASAKYN